MLGAKIDVGRRWGREYAAEINLEVRHALERASEHGAQVAAGAAQARRRTGKMAQIEPLEVVGTPDGWEGGFRSPAFYARFQSSGTRRGITPLKFLEQGRAAARKDLIRRIQNL